MKSVTFVDNSHILTWTRKYETTEEYFEIMDNTGPEWELILPERIARGGAWLDSMNSCFYTVIGELDNYWICREIGSGEVFTLPKI